MVWSRLPATLQLGGFAILVSTLIAIPIGVLAAVYKDTMFDGFGKLVALLGQAMPNFWLGIVLIWVFAVIWNVFPTSGRGGLGHMVLPAIAMGWFQVAALMRLTRSAMLEVLDSEYVKLARLKGVAEWRVIWMHALRNAAITPLTLFRHHCRVDLHGLGRDRDGISSGPARDCSPSKPSVPGTTRWCRRWC